MRISDWSSDVCSSDLVEEAHLERHGVWIELARGALQRPQQQFAEQRLPCLGDAVARRVPAMPGTDRLDQLAAPKLVQVHRDHIRGRLPRSDEHTSELQSLMRLSYAVFCLKKKNQRET